jgi:type VI secretion system secreted protein VgrG
MPEIGSTTTFHFEVEGLGSKLSVARFEGREAVSDLFQFKLFLMSEDKDIAFSSVVGKPARLVLNTDKSEPRYVHGIVSRFEHAGEGKKFSIHHATLVPRLFRLLHRHDSRIFQALAVPDILEKVLKDAGFSSSDYRLSIRGAHPKREYCVQYRESDFAFISRLMEEEGIFYFFEHTEDGHVLVMCDATSACAPIAGPDMLSFRAPLGAMALGESVSRFFYAEEVRPGKVTLTDYNFKKPSLSLLSSAQAGEGADLEVYDYPGEYEMPGDGSTLAKIRLEEWQSLRKVGAGDSGCVRFTPGYTFELSEHPRADHDRRYLLVEVQHRGAQPQMAESAEAAGPSYTNSFQCIPDDVPYRPERKTPRPTIKGVQTAVVTGAGGTEIHTDEHGRVKVQFHWDRQGKKDDKSSCWIRVSQVWAGQGWGAIYIPRVGHEVIVDFIEGDPDQPIIVGRVYHGTNAPPYPLPGNKTKSTLKSSSSQGGDGSNELRFEDQAGSEEIYLHGQKDWNIKIEHDKGQRVGHDEALEVGNDRTKHVKHNQSETVDSDKKIQVGGNHAENIDGNATIHVGKDHTESVDGKESLSIGQTRSVTVGSDQTTSIGGNHSITVSKSHDETITIAMTLNVGAAKTENVGAVSSESVGAAKSLSVGAAYSINVGAAMSTSVGANQSTSVSGNQSSNVGGDKTVVVGKKVVVTCGEASITLEKSGKITVSGKDITVTGTGDVSVSAKNVKVKSDGKVNVEASGNVTVKGGKVELN